MYKGCAKEAAGSLSGNEDAKSEGKSDEDKGTLKREKGGQRPSEVAMLRSTVGIAHGSNRPF